MCYFGCKQGHVAVENSLSEILCRTRRYKTTRKQTGHHMPSARTVNLAAMVPCTPLCMEHYEPPLTDPTPVLDRWQMDRQLKHNNKPHNTSHHSTKRLHEAPWREKQWVSTLERLASGLISTRSWWATRIGEVRLVHTLLGSTCPSQMIE